MIAWLLQIEELYLGASDAQGPLESQVLIGHDLLEGTYRDALFSPEAEANAAEIRRLSE